MEQPKNPLHGLTLEILLTRLVEYHGWERLAGFIRINCFQKDPSISSSLKFLRRTPWARARVENFYLNYQGHPWNKPGYQNPLKASENSQIRP